MSKIIYSLWMQGEEQAPALSKACFSRWREINPDYEVRVLTAADVPSLTAHLPFDVSVLPAPAISDIVRIELLARYGGVWTDASVLPIVPLRLWLPEIIKQSGFFGFAAPAPDRPISSWFIAAEPSSAVVALWRQAVADYWTKPRQPGASPHGPRRPLIIRAYRKMLRAAGLSHLAGQLIPKDISASLAQDRDIYPYFWFHYLFGRLLDSSPEVADLWAKTPKFSAIPLHSAQATLRDHPSNADAFLRAVVGTVVQKLDWRLQLTDEMLARLPSF